jgi:hypothetical protein
MRIFSVVLPSLVQAQTSKCSDSIDSTASCLAASCTFLLCLIKEDGPMPPRLFEFGEPPWMPCSFPRLHTAVTALSPINDEFVADRMNAPVYPLVELASSKRTERHALTRVFLLPDRAWAQSDPVHRAPAPPGSAWFAAAQRPALRPLDRPPVSSPLKSPLALRCDGTALPST